MVDENFPIKISKYVSMGFYPPTQISLKFSITKRVVYIDYSAVLRICERVATLKQQKQLAEECRKVLGGDGN